jgi:hypothetical protein
MPNTFIDPKSFLIDLLKRMVEILRTENNFAFRLLKEVTVNKKAVIQLDNVKLYLSAAGKKNYSLTIREAQEAEKPDFISTATTLREIINGVTTLDKALTLQQIYLKAPLADMLGMYRLVICLLTRGITDFQLRRLWFEFETNWPKNKFDAPLKPLNRQLASHGLLIQGIPEKVLFIQTE